ncbi:hypothetical protein H6F89_32885 [Cyanobacteria bacterium FACHB-63]|nr:hypothetical protein [Cyanobacteria bacterium FACHB-63]
MYNLTKFTLGDMTECGAALRKLGNGADSMEEVANRTTRYFYEHFLDPETGQNAFALVRFFKTHAYCDLDTELRRFADQMLDDSLEQPEMKCLTLLATVGDQPEWSDRSASKGHQAIPLPSEQMVAQAPMISQLISQLGLTINDVLSPDPDLLLNLQERTYNVFYIPEAKGSIHIPAQEEFIHPFEIKSVLGFGGILPSGNLIAVILFSKMSIQRDIAELFKLLALNVKMAVLPFDQQSVFRCVVRA